MSVAPVLIRKLPIGLVIDGRYEITGFIGAGGFAQVYAGRQINVERAVAIKVLNLFKEQGISPADVRHQASRERFVREAKVMASLKHTAVVSVHDFGFLAETSQPYIVMENLEGHTLEAELSNHGPMAPARALKLVGRCLEALGEAHQKGIVHRDLKPSNIFIVAPGTPQEDVRLLDYGIASISQSKDDRLTATGQIIGTYRYLSPEYIKGRIALPALDVYQMGLILTEMLTGQPVVEGGNHFATLMVHVEGRIELPEALVACSLGPALCKALATNHAARFDDANAFLKALSDVDPDDLPKPPAAAPTVRLSEVSASPRSIAVPPSRISSTEVRAFTPAEAPRRILIPTDLDKALADKAAEREEERKAEREARRAAKAARARDKEAQEATLAQETQAEPPAPEPPPAEPQKPQEAPPAAPPPQARGLDPRLFAGVVGALLVALLALAVAWKFSPGDSAGGAAAAAVTITLISEPPGATLLEGRTVLGNAPLDFRFDSTTSPPKQIEVRLSDHAPQTVTVSPTGAPSVHVKLDPRTP